MSLARRSRFVLAVGTLSAASACAAGPNVRDVTPMSGDRFFVSGYHAWWAGDAWSDYPWDALDELYFFELDVGADGTLVETRGWPDGWTPLLERAREADVRVVPTVSLHDVAAFVTLFSDPARVDVLVESLVALLASTPDVGGLHLDFEVFERVPTEARDGYSAFVAELRLRMRTESAEWALSAFALAFDDDDVYDEPALARSTDFLIVQGYDFHSRAEARAGPVAAVRGWGRLNWETVVDRFLGFGVPARKIVMAVPLYGYEWPVASDAPGAATRGEAVEIPLTAPDGVVPEMPRAFAQAARHGARRDPQSGSPYYAFQDSTGWRQGWYEDAESLRAKYALVRERGLGGIALFPLAYGDPLLWADLRAAFNLPREAPGTPR